MISSKRFLSALPFLTFSQMSMVETVKFCHQKSKKQHEAFSLQMAPHSPAGSPASPSLSLHRDWGSPGLRAQPFPTVGGYRSYFSTGYQL